MADKWQREFWLQVGLSSESWPSRHDGWNLKKVSTWGQDILLPSLTHLPSHGVVESLNHVQLFCNPMDCSPPGSSVHGILQTKVLEWVAIYFSRVSSWPRNGTHIFYIGKWILYHWAIREALTIIMHIYTYAYIYAHINIIQQEPIDYSCVK